MNKLTTSLIPIAMLALGTAAQGQLLINEIRVDHTGADVDEYFELFGAPNASLNGLTYVVIGDSTGGLSGVIENVSSLDSLTLNASGFFLGGTASMTLATPDQVFTLAFENSDNVTHLLVSGFTGALADDLDTNDDGVLDILPWTSVLDAVSFIEEPNPPLATEFSYGSSLGGSDVGPDGIFAPGHIYRSPDGGAWQIGQFDLVGGADTPGATNVPEPSTYALLLGALGLGVVLRRKGRN